MCNYVLEFKGPHQINEDVHLALQSLQRLIRAEVSQHEHHCVIRICGMDQGDIVIQNIAVYLVGAIASCVAFNMEIRSALFNEETLIPDLHRDVKNVVGENNNIDENEKTYERNPWLWEGISHLFLHLSLENATHHPPDRLLAKSSIHLNVKDHGLDVIALYGTDSLGVTLGECKAYLQRPAKAITDAANRLGEVDGNLRDAEIRATLSQFRSSLLSTQQDMLVRSFWQNERAYFPMVCCDSSNCIDWAMNRLVLRRLQPPTNRKYLVSLSIDSAEFFFDSVSEAMRAYACTDGGGTSSV